MTPPRKAILGGAIAGTSAMLLLLLAVLPYAWRASVKGEIAAQVAELELLKSRIAARNERGGPLLSEAQPLDSMFLPGATAGTTLASFQEFVTSTAAVSGLAVLRMQPLPVEETGRVHAYRLAVDVTGSLEQLRAFLVDVEAMLPVVIVTGFDIGPQSDGEEAGTYPAENLAASLRLEAFGWKATP